MEIFRKMKKVITGTIALSFIMLYVVPAGMCASASGLPPLPQSAGKSASSSNITFGNDSKFSSKNPLITLSLRNSDVKQVLRMFADKAGMNIIFHTSVDNPQDQESQRKVVSNVTMDLVKVPLNEAFNMVLEVANLTYITEGNTLIVMSIDSAKESTIGRQGMSVLPVKYLDASKVANFLNKNIYSSGKAGLSNAKIAVTNTERNEVLLFGNQNDYKIAKEILTRFDVKPNEGTFIVNHTTPREMSALVCKVLFKDLAKKDGDEAVMVLNDKDEEKKDKNNDDDDDDDETEKVKVGEGKVACQFRAPVGDNSSNDGLASLDSGGLTIVYYADRGTIYARGGTVEQMSQIKDFIAKNDKRQFQAYLEMSIVELSETGSKEFSNTWNIYSSFFTGGFGTSLVSSAPIYIKGNEVPSIYQSEQTPILAKYTGAPVITYAMNYLIQNGKGRVLANPRILITSGKKATIDLTSSYIKKVTSQVMDTVASSAGAVQRTYDIGDDLGIKIELQPYISPDGYVTMNIIPEYSTVKEQVTEPRTLVTQTEIGTTQIVNDIVATLIDKRKLNLKNIRIKDGETMVIGGLLQETESKTINKFPILGDLPLVGIFFRSTSSQKQKNELVIMLTPRLIKDSIEDVKEKAML